ncbi:MAG: nitrilase-related carbon-nitrogen hydrolase [Bacilli bacterium]
MKVSLCQSAPIQGDVDATLALITEAVRKSGINGYNAELIVFPELFITGYFPELWNSRPTPADELSWIDQLREAAETEGISVLCGHPSYRAQTNEYGRSRSDTVSVK